VVGKVEVMTVRVDIHDRLRESRFDLSRLCPPYRVAAPSDADIDRTPERPEIGWVDVVTLHGSGDDGEASGRRRAHLPEPRCGKHALSANM